ncbi:MAG: DNA polymerase III subunit delta, partial [Chlamydiota bacterium]
QSAGIQHLAPVYLLISKNSRDITDAVGLVKQVVGGVDILSFSGETLKLNSFLDELQTISAFSPKRLVILKNADKLKKTTLQTLSEYFSKTNPQVHLILTASAVDKRTSFYKTAELSGVILDIPEEKPWMREKTVQRWLREKVYQDGKQVEPRACELLMQQIGTDQDLLVQELNKLYCYIGERPIITYEDVCAISSNVNVDDIWKLGEAIFHFNVSVALEVFKALLDDGAPFLTLLRQLRSQFQSSFQICTILACGKGRDEVSKQFPYLTPHLLNKKLQVAQGYGIARFKEGLLTIDDTEYKAKNSLGEEAFLGEMLIVKLSTK